MGYDIENMGITLDLFPRKNKNTHGFAFCIKPGKDARILANLTNNAKSLDTIMHELGHCVYDIGIDPNLPFVEQDCSSPVMTEAIAMMTGDLPKAEDMLNDYVPAEVLTPFMNELKEDDAKFVTRSLEIINFEREMYKNPEQDLKLLWKNMKQKYLYRGNTTEINNEWATIPHYLSHPGYYQNYFRAALLKAQIYNAMRKELGDITKNQNAAKFLNERLFKFGSSVWEEDLIIQLTGKPLSEDDFCSRITK
jgi:peptidyl-dipeptidase A